MASASGVRAGKAYVELSLKDNLDKGLSAVSAKMQSFGAGIAKAGAGLLAVGGAGLGAFGAAAKLFSDTGSELNDMSARTGLSIEALSSFGFAAEQTGASLGDVEAGQKKLQKTMVDAANGSKEAKSALDDIGLSAEQLASMSPEDQFRAVSKGIASIENPAKRTEAAMSIMGKSATNLLGTMSELAELEARHEKLGLGLTTADAASADAMGDAWGELVAVGKGLVMQIGAALAPTITTLIGNVVEIASASLKWIKENRGLVIAVAGVTAGVAAAGAVLVGLGTGIALIGTIIGGIMPVVAALGGALAFLVSPIGLIGIGVAALAGYLIYSTGAWKEWLASLTTAFNVVKEDATTAFSGIKDALSTGDVGTAWQIALEFLRLEWLRTTGFMQEKWAGVKNYLLDSWGTAATEIGNVLRTAAAGAELAWIEITNPILSAWYDMAEQFGDPIIDALAEAAKAFVAFQVLTGQLSEKQGKALTTDQIMGPGGKMYTGTLGFAKEKYKEAMEQSVQEGRKELPKRGTNVLSEMERKNREAIARNEAEIAARRSSGDGGAANREAIAAAEKRLAGLQQQAADAAAKVADGSKKKANAAGSLDELKSADSKISTTGTFAASAVRGLGGGSAADRTARATEATVAEVKKVGRKLETERVG